ncbi:MAG: ATP-binding cassette domain-containing protein [Chromatiales bacterium]|nr:ATP-binding cassette domain-containing protein [Chromatiales bacterium]
MNPPLLSVRRLSIQYSVRQSGLFGRTRQLQAVDDVSFDLMPGETLGIVGETGCGKSSLGKGVLQLVRPSAGQVLWQGRDLCQLSPQQLKPFRKDLQIIFQDPLSSLNPRMTVGEIVGEPLELHAPELDTSGRERAVDAMLERVGLRAEMKRRYPNEFSGGQCQRISIARAMIMQPRVIVCDEPVSALDVSIQAQICNLLRELQRDTGVALLFISHDLSIVRYMSHRVMIMYLGRVMETAPREHFFGAARHPYSRALISAVPQPDPDQPTAGPVITLDGDLPSPLDPPSGCVFRTRCPHAIPLCAGQPPALESFGQDHEAACHRARELQ